MGNFLNTQCFVRKPSILMQKKGYTSSAIYIPTAEDIHSRKKKSSIKRQNSRGLYNILSCGSKACKS